MGCLAFIFFIAIFAFLAILISLMRMVFGVRNAARRFMGEEPPRKPQSRTEQAQGNKPKKEKEKHFDKDEGEYVDFEEV